VLTYKILNKMKTIFKKALRNALVYCTVIVSFSACVNKDEFFELPDRGGIDARIWSNEGAIQMLLDGTYRLIMPEFPYQYTINQYGIHLASDENYFSGTEAWARRAIGVNGTLANNDVRYVATKYQGSNVGDNRYFDIARCNNAIKGIPTGTLPKATQDKLLGQFYALRAMAYFELTRIYGGVPLVLEPQDPDNITVSGRAKAADCINAIVNDLDSAMVKLNGISWADATERGKINRAAAASLKAKVLLYWASPQFNPVNDPQHPYDAARWQRALEANREAYDICLASGRKLMANYATIFQTEGTSNTEAIMVRSYSSTLERRGHNVESRIRPASEGGSPNDAYFATTKLLNAYPMRDGRPIQGHPDYDATLFWRNRDPRFEATIAYNGSNWKLSGNNNRRQWTYTNAINESGNRGVYCKRFSSPDLSASAVNYTSNIGGSGMDWIELRFAEVMLNYAECANETGDMVLAKTLVREIRRRAGIIEGTAGNDFGLGLATTIEQMRELITNERMVEFAFEAKRHHDLRRLRKMHTLTGTIEGIQIATKTTALRTHLEAINPTTGLRNRDTLNINVKSTYLFYFNPHTVVIPGGNGPFSVPEYHYFYTFHNQFMNSSPLLEHTIGWEGGTFDPLK